MPKFDFMKKYVQDPNCEDIRKEKHIFFKVEKDAIIKSEEKMGRKFPKELRQFYSEIGSGFMCNHDYDMFDRFMGPASVADFYTCTGQFVYNPSIDYFLENNLFVFFEVSEDTYLSIDIDKENEKGEAPITYFGTQIAPSIEVFLKRMEDETDYYLEFIE